jgi:hypothetical protein
MTFFHHEEWFAPTIAVFMLMAASYVAGRVHQFFKQTVDREQAFRDGYNQATKSLFALATRVSKALPAQPLMPDQARSVKGFASVPTESLRPIPARHRAQGRRKMNESDTRRYENWPIGHTA